MIKPGEVEIHATARMVKFHLEGMYLTEQQMNTIIGWMMAEEGYPMIRFGQQFGLISPSVPNGLPPLVKKKCRTCKHTAWVREGETA
jgi:hypothetical protein